MDDNALGSFLRARRDGVTPAEVGLPPGLRRRAPGLRRSEVAMLAGISVEYLTRLEQGRDRQPSAQVLGAIAEALRLTPDERFHLLILSKSAAGQGNCLACEPPSRQARETLSGLLGQLEPHPACVVNRLGDVLAFTSGFAQLFAPAGLLDRDPPSLLHHVFTDPRARALYADWDVVADQQVASLHRELLHGDEHVTGLANELSVLGGRDFIERWQAPPEVPSTTGVHRLVHPDVGELRLAFEILDPLHSDQRLMAYLPADDASAAALDRLQQRRPGALRAVNE